MTPIRTVALSLMESCGSLRPLGLPAGALQHMGVNDITELLATAHRENKITTQRYTQLRQEWVSHIQNAGYVQDVTDIMYGSSNPRTFSSPVTPPGKRVINHAAST